jgi:hypothetical protein
MNDLDDVDRCQSFFFVFIVLRLLDCAVAGRLYGEDITTKHWQDEELRIVGLFIIASHQRDAFDTTNGDCGSPEALLWGVRRGPAGGGSSTITGSLYCINNNIINNNKKNYDSSLFFIVFFLFFASQPTIFFIIIFIIIGLDRSQIRGHSRRPDRYEIYP